MWIAGWLLLSAFVCGVAAAATPSLGRVWVAPLPHQLRLISTRRSAWIASSALFAVALWFAAAGATALTVMLYEAGSTVVSWIGLTSLLVGSALWLVHLALRITVTQLVAKAMGEDGPMPDWYEPIAWWGAALLGGYFVMANAGFGALAIAVLSTGRLDEWSAWVVIFLVVLFLATFALFRNTLPVLPQVHALVLGIAAFMA